MRASTRRSAKSARAYQRERLIAACTKRQGAVFSSQSGAGLYIATGSVCQLHPVLGRHAEDIDRRRTAAQLQGGSGYAPCRCRALSRAV